MKKKGAIYLRVSTEDQHPENQITGVKRFAEALQYEVVEIYIDKESGKYSDRKEFQRMMVDARIGKFQTLFIWALDRFSREGIAMTLTHIEHLKKYGVSIRSFQESWLDTSQEGISELLIAVLSYAAKEELKRIKERSMAGKVRVLSSGDLVGCIPPYGYKYFKKTARKKAHFKIHKKEAEAVKYIFRDYLTTDSITNTAKRLYKAGFLGRKGTAFHKTTVRKILLSTSYIGEFHYKEFTIKIPKIIDKGTFKKAQRLIKKNRREYMRPTKHFYLCQGLIKCTHCDRRYSTNIMKPRGKIFLNYICPQKYRSKVDEPVCRSRMIGVNKLDRIVWNYIVSLITNKKRIEQALRDSYKQRGENRKQYEKEYNALMAEQGRIKRKGMRILDLYGDENIDRKSLDAKMEQLNVKGRQVASKIEEVQEDLERIDNQKTLENEIRKLVLEYGKIIKGLTDGEDNELKKYIIRKWVKEIKICDGGDIEIIVGLPSLDKKKEEVIPMNVLNIKSDYVFQDTNY